MFICLTHASYSDDVKREYSRIYVSSLFHSVFSPTGSHVEWCKQLIAATISSQISGSVQPDIGSRDIKVDNTQHTQTHTLLAVILIRVYSITNRLGEDQTSW